MSTLCDGQSAWDCCHGNRAKGTREREINKQTNKGSGHTGTPNLLVLCTPLSACECVCVSVHSNHSSAALMCKYSLNMLDFFLTSAGKKQAVRKTISDKNLLREQNKTSGVHTAGSQVSYLFRF